MHGAYDGNDLIAAARETRMSFFQDMRGQD